MPRELHNELDAALGSAYGTPEALVIMVRRELDANLYDFAPSGSLQSMRFHLIAWAEMAGRLADLVEGMCHDMPGNTEIQAVQRKYYDWRSTVGSSVQPGAEPVVRDEDRAVGEAIGKHELALFVGTGTSTDAGLPSWYALAAELARKSEQKIPPIEWATSDQISQIAQNYVNRHGLNSLIRYLKERLDTYNVRPTPAHRGLAELPVQLAFTANYDDLLERAFREAGRRVQVVVQDSDVPFMLQGPGTVNIVKLFGDLNQPGTVVLASQQYERYFLDRPQLIRLLETELSRLTMLYVGWSHTDPYMNLLFGELRARLGPMGRTGYSVMFDPRAGEAEELQRKQIRPIQLAGDGDRVATLAQWLHTLASQA
ncbi:MAG: SIR2 family protein [Caldilineaceae bacterium]